jgi:hypothetical protein
MHRQSGTPKWRLAASLAGCLSAPYRLRASSGAGGGGTSAAAAQTATLATRPAEGAWFPEAELREGWSHHAQEVGVKSGWHRRLLGRTATSTPDLTGLVDELIDREAITATSASFTRRDALQAVAERLPEDHQPQPRPPRQRDRGR